MWKGSAHQPQAAGRAVLVQAAELSEPAHGGAVFLVEPGELEPELVLRDASGGVAAGEEDAQRGVAGRTERMDGRLQRPQLFQSAPRQDPDRSSPPAQL